MECDSSETRNWSFHPPLRSITSKAIFEAFSQKLSEMNAGMCLRFSRSHGLYVFILHTGLDSRAPKVKICSNERKMRPLQGCKEGRITSKASRQISTCWCSHLPSRGCGNQHLYGRRTGFISMDEQGGPLGFAIGLTCACQHSSPQNFSCPDQVGSVQAGVMETGEKEDPWHLPQRLFMGSHSLAT